MSKVDTERQLDVIADDRGVVLGIDLGGTKRESCTATFDIVVVPINYPLFVSKLG